MDQNINISSTQIKPIDACDIGIDNPAFRHLVSGANDGSSFDKILMDRLGSLVTGTRRIERNARLFRNHERLGSLYVVRFGQFKLIGNDSNGQQFVVDFRMAGDWLGLNAIATGYHDLGVIALDDSEVLEVPFHASERMTEVYSPVQQKIFEVMSEELHKKYSESRFLCAPLDCRFARFLLSLGEKYASLGYARKIYRLSMSRTDIGSYLGSTCESVSRLVARFNAAGIVRITGRSVEIHNRIALDALSNGYQLKAHLEAMH